MGQTVRSNSDFSGPAVAAGEDSGAGLNALERFMRDRFAAGLFGREPGQWKPLSYLVIALTVGYAGYMLSEAARLTPPSAQELWSLPLPPQLTTVF